MSCGWQVAGLYLRLHQFYCGHSAPNYQLFLSIHSLNYFPSYVLHLEVRVFSEQ